MKNLKINTHKKINNKLCGTIIEIEEGKCKIELKTNEDMIVDDYGLIHGGFIFGLADYAAMISVNDPNVVLGSSEVTFLKPVKLGDILIAYAEIVSKAGRKYSVKVNVNNGELKVFSGIFQCFILSKHVLSKNNKKG